MPNLESLPRYELIEIYNRFVLPLPQREKRRTHPNLEAQSKRVDLKRKITLNEAPTHSKSIKLVRDGISDLKLDKLKRPAADLAESSDDPMDGGQSRTKRKPITWP